MKEETKESVENSVISRETAEAMQRGLEHARNEWRVMALEVLYEYAKTHERFTVNEFRTAVDRSPIKTHDKRAMGGVMATGAKLKWIKKSGAEIASRVGHGAPLQVWESLIVHTNVPMQFPSKRHVHGRYVVLERDGKITCNCPGFLYKKHCRHVDEVRRSKAPTLGL